MKWFDLRSLSRGEALTCVLLALLFLTATTLFIGLRPEHLLITGLFVVLFFAAPATRRLAVALLPFVLFGISYDWMRLVPNYEVNPIDTRPLYEAERALFGITVDGQCLIPGEYFNAHHWSVADLLAGIFYLCWVPVPIAFGLWLYFSGQRRHYLRFAVAFLFVNLHAGLVNRKVSAESSFTSVSAEGCRVQSQVSGNYVFTVVCTIFGSSIVI